MRKAFNIFCRYYLIILIGAAAFVLSGCTGNYLGVLNPKGIVAFEERKLLFDTLSLMLIVVIPVIIMSIAFVYHYQVSHRIRDYKPHWSHSHFLETIWWVIPCVIVVILGVITWKKTHELDPYQKIATTNQEIIDIEVIALPWKWLFIYPKQNIATINYLVLPVNQQARFTMTADNSAMCAFFIPQLGSQIYVMAGMRTLLHLVPTEIGIYDGMNTQFNGPGFSDMHFAVHVMDTQQMQHWIETVKKSSTHLTNDDYIKLLKPSIDSEKFYANAPKDLFETVLNTYQMTYGNKHPRFDQAQFSKE
jgi:cytochrome o ubiquinol oxidase subunit 2